MNEMNEGPTNGRPSDELLMAYVDGEASPAEAEAVEAVLSADPAVADRLAMFAETRALAAEALPLEPVPDELRAAVEAMIAAGSASKVADAAAAPEMPDAPEAPEGKNVVAFRRRGGGRRFAGPAFMAMAATVAGLAVAVGSFVAGSRFGGDVAPGPAGGVGQLAQVPLEAGLVLPSGSELALGEDRVLRPKATFRSGTGELCREFEVEGADTVLGVACRRGADWSVDFAVATPAPDPTGYVPASGFGALDAFLDTIAAEPPLGAQEEAEALAPLR